MKYFILVAIGLSVAAVVIAAAIRAVREILRKRDI
jgi:hypothetical protein